MMNKIIGLALLLFSGAIFAQSYQLELKITEPGDTRAQYFKFCSASFYESDVEEGYTYGTTAGHCLDVYQVQRDRVQDRVWGADLEIVVNIDGRYEKVESVRHGMRGLQWFREDPRNRNRPDPNAVRDWGVIKTKADVDTLTITEEKLTTGDQITVKGYPMALGYFESTGTATYPYRLPNTSYDGFIAADYSTAPGSSGSPVLNEDGEQVGILVAGIRGVNISLATPIYMVRFPTNAISPRGGPQKSHPAHLNLYNNLDLPMPDVQEFVDQYIQRQ